MTMETQAQAMSTMPRREPWNKGKLIGQKPLFRPKYVWSIRTRLQMEGRTQAHRNLAACTTEGSLHYVWMAWRDLGEALAAGREVYGELKNLCVWVKDNGGMGSLYRSQH
jgi:hypothetical protein